MPSSWYTATTADLSCLRESLRLRSVIIPIQQRKEGVLEKADELFAASQGSWHPRQSRRHRQKPGIQICRAGNERNSGSYRMWTEGYRERTGCYLSAVIQEKNMSFPLKSLLPKFRKFLILCRRKCWSAHVHTAMLTLMLQQTYEEFKDTINNKPGFVKAMWCGDQRSARTRSKKMSRQPPDACHLQQEQLSERCLRMLRKTG